MAEQTAVEIESNDLAISQIFKDFYAVADFQREYVSECEHVEKLLEDMLDEFYDEDNRLVEGPEYFLGSIVAFRDHEGTQLDRAAADLIQFEHWNSQTIAQRQEILSALARKVWDMPTDSKDVTA